MMNRRTFLKSLSCSIGVATAPVIIPGSALGKNGAVAPSDRIVIGCIGLGGQGTHNMRAFINQPDTEIRALCDVDEGVGDFDMLYQEPGNRDAGLQPAVEKAIDAYKNRGAVKKPADFSTFIDFRELLARQDIDAVTVCTPDHWHGLISIAAAQAGKDIYCEKPLVNSVIEGREVCDAVQQHNRILQTGSHERSNNSVRYAYELVANGRIGTLKEIHVNMPNSDDHHMTLRQDNGPHPEMPIPKGFHYDLWLGPASWAPYTKKRAHFWWRFILETGGGEMTDRGAHIIDLAQFMNDADDSGPITLEATGEQVKSKLFDCFIEYKFECRYKNGLKLFGTSEGDRGLKLVGDQGWIFIHIHGGRLEASNPDILKSVIGPNEIHTQYSPGHHRNFLDAVKSRKKAIAHEEIGHRTATICHLLNIGMLLNKPISWDPVKEISTDDAVNKMLKRPMRSPWRL
ncbi:gfo/Idh/MocA family oxidoreductase [candidate division KSB1 bacterium]|nr:Gfo/Idh/MocA family oxidoreductase [candidate division KSB1 bacterium]RQW00137.1 MAG: gfo/Idh/MocA family oxidoreductase [candidate division KSB1 bacterium]